MRTNIARNTWILFLSSILLLLGFFLEREGYSPVISSSLQTAGTAILSLLVGFWIYDLFGGTPEIREMRNAMEEFKQGKESDRLGIKKLYKRRVDAKAEMLADISQSHHSVKMFAAVYVGEILKDPALPEALLKAIRHSTEPFTFEYYSFDPTGEFTPSALLEAWSVREGDSAPNKLVARIARGSELFGTMVKNVKNFGAGSFTGVRKYYKSYLSPHALLVIDDDIVYVALYDWGNKQGDFAPTLRLKDGPWAETFIREAQVVSEKFSVVAAKY